MNWKAIFKGVGKIIKWLSDEENRAIANVVLKPILEKIHNKDESPVVVIVAPPKTAPSVPGAPSEPIRIIVPAPVAELAEPDALEAHIMSAEWWARGPHGGGLYGFKAVQNLRSGEGPAQPGDRIHMDVTPSAAGVLFVPGGPENAALLRPGLPEHDAAIMSHEFDSNLVELESEYDGGGTTPVLRVNADFRGEDTVRYRAVFKRKDGREIKSNEVTFRIKGKD